MISTLEIAKTFSDKRTGKVFKCLSVPQKSKHLNFWGGKKKKKKSMLLQTKINSWDNFMLCLEILSDNLDKCFQIIFS